MVFTERNKNRKHYSLKINKPHFITILSNLEKGLELVSFPHNRAKNELKMSVISCTNISKIFHFFFLYSITSVNF